MTKLKKRLLYLLALLVVEVVWSNVFEEEDTLGCRRGCGCGLCCELRGCCEAAGPPEAARGEAIEAAEASGTVALATSTVSSNPLALMIC